jgi:hypothetical protein
LTLGEASRYAHAVNDEQHHAASLLLAIVNRRWQEAERLLAERPADPAAFLALCRECDVHGRVASLLEREGRGDLFGSEIASGLALMRTKLQRDNLLLLALAEQALDLLLAAGVQPLALKGLDLLHRIYDRFDERSMDDVDLLLRPSDLPRALAALEAAGWHPLPEPQRTHYIRSSHHLPVRSPAAIPVDLELHWNLVQDRRFRLPVGELFARARPLTVSGRQLLRLEDNDLAAHLLLHHFAHYFDRRLKWAVDLQALVRLPGFSWEVVGERLRSWGAGAAAGMSLRHLHKLVPEAIPPAALAALPVARWRLALTRPLRSDHPLELFRARDARSVQLYLAAVLLERPLDLPAWMLRRARRDQRASSHPLDPERVQ